MKDRTVQISYLPPRSLREMPVLPPGELEVQALWFEQFYQPGLTTDDARTVEIIQPGFWNHGGGPDFTRAVVRFSKNGTADDEVTIGSVEVHLRPGDWNAHGHHADAAYNETILHVVWEARGGKGLFPGDGILPARAASGAGNATHRAVGGITTALRIADARPAARRGAGTLFAGTGSFARGASRGHPPRGGSFPFATKSAALVLAAAPDQSGAGGIAKECCHRK